MCRGVSHGAGRRSAQNAAAGPGQRSENSRCLSVSALIPRLRPGQQNRGRRRTISVLNLKKIQEDAERRLRDWIEPQHVGVPRWAHQEIQATTARIKSSPGCLTEKEQERFNSLLQWQRQDEAYWQERRERAIEVRELLEQEREQERRMQEQQKSERQARRVQRLERKMRELKKGLEAVRARAEETGDEKTAAIVHTAFAELARSGREKRAKKLETDPWRISAQKTILTAIKANSTLNNTKLTDKVVEGLKTDKIRGRSRRQIERIITDMRDGGIIPALPRR